MRNRMIFRPMLVLTLLLLGLLTGCGGGLSGSATGQNASDMEALQERLRDVADVLNEINGYHNEFEDLANESLVSADDLVAQIDELIDMGDQVDPSTLEELIENREELTSDMGFIEVIQNLKVERDAVMGEVLESFKSDIEYYMAQSSEDSGNPLQPTTDDRYEELALSLQYQNDQLGLLYGELRSIEDGIPEIVTPTVPISYSCPPGSSISGNITSVGYANPGVVFSGDPNLPNGHDPQSIRLRVSLEGMPLANCEIRYEIEDGNGWFNPANTQTDNNGEIHGYWTAGPYIGEQIMSAYITWPDGTKRYYTLYGQVTDTWTRTNSVHLNYEPSGEYEKFSIRATPGTAPLTTYYSTINWNGAYGGIQFDGDTTMVLFSTWDTDGMDAEIVDSGDCNKTVGFGGEGTGVSCRLKFPPSVYGSIPDLPSEYMLVAGHEYETAIDISDCGTNCQDYSFTFSDITRGLGPVSLGTQRYKSDAVNNWASSFVEEWFEHGNCLSAERSVVYHDVKAMVNGEWEEINRARFTPNYIPDNNEICANYYAEGTRSGFQLSSGGDRLVGPPRVNGDSSFPNSRDVEILTNSSLESNPSPIIPTPNPTVAPTPSVVTRSYGTINMGQKDTGIFEAHPSKSSNPRIPYVSSSIGEGLITTYIDWSPNPMLAESWSISSDFMTWSWKFQEGVQFHKGYGEMTAEDVLYSYQQWYAGARHPRSRIIGDYFNSGSRIVDDYTLEVDTDVPWVPAQVFEFVKNGGGSSSWVVSKKQSEEIGIEAANRDIAATGPWQIEDHQNHNYWRMSAVEDHWRQSPYFDELVYWSIPEEAARVAGFQTGQLDSFNMAFHSLESVETVDGATVLGYPNGGQAGLNFYGQLYGLDKDGNEYEHYDPTLAWVSSDLDTDSQAWKDAVKVRKALNIAIDRRMIVDEHLWGFGDPLGLRDWIGHEDRANPDWVYDYDPDLAKQLITEAGYPDGFQITLTPAIRGAPAEVEACEAVAQYWEAIGLEVRFQHIPYAALRPGLITRQYQGATCHTVGPRNLPIVGASSYQTMSTFSYGTHHPWLDENVGDAINEVDPVENWDKTLRVYDWIFDNAMASGLYSHDAIWPVGPRLNPVWSPTDWSDVRIPTSFEYAQPR